MIVKDHKTSKPATYTIPEDPSEKEAFLAGGWDALRISYGTKAVALLRVEQVRDQAYHPRRKVKRCKNNGKDYVVVKLINAKF